MKLVKWILGSLLVLLLVLSLSAYGLYKYKNRRIKPDYHETYKMQDTVPVGKVGIFATALIMPEKLDTVFFYNISQKVFKNIIPWPFRTRPRSSVLPSTSTRMLSTRSIRTKSRKFRSFSNRTRSRSTPPSWFTKRMMRNCADRVSAWWN